MSVALEVPITSCSDPHSYFVLLRLHDMLMSVVSISVREIKPYWNDYCIVEFEIFRYEMDIKL